VLDNSGDLTKAVATAAITSRGLRGIGFVDFGRVAGLDARASRQTFGGRGEQIRRLG
jgi:hypothetical protein